MAVIRIHAQKDARCMQAVCQINGDRRTQILRFDVNRFDGGVDLGGLRWVIKTTNALGVEDIFDPEVVEIKERTITVDWLVNGSVTDGDGMATYELNGIDTTEDGQPVQWSGGKGSISVRAGHGPKFGESDGMTNIEKLILYVEGELENVVEAGSAALDAAERANHAADVLGDPAEAVDRANAAAQRAETAATTVGDLEAAVNRANAAAAEALNTIDFASVAASDARNAAARASEAAKNVENIEEATLAAHEAAETANLAAATAAEAALPHVQLYGRRVMGEVAKASGNPVTCLADAGSLLQPVTVLEPKQQGSGEPYPAGGGRNLFKNTVASATINGVTLTMNNDDRTVTLNGTASANTSWNLGYFTPASDMEIILNGSNGGSTSTYMLRLYDGNGSTNLLTAANGDSAAFKVTGGTSYRVYVFVMSGTKCENVKLYPMIRVSSDANSAYAAWDNIRPFIGWDKLGLTVAGRNLLPDFKNTTINGVTLKKLDDGGFTLSGTASAMTYFTVEFAPVLPAAKYTISMNNPEMLSRGDFWFGMFDESDERLDADIFGSVNRKRSVTIAKDIRYFKIQIPGGLTLNNFVIKPQVEKGDAATEYSTPSRVFTVQIGQTVYGGKMNWLTGGFRAEWWGKTFNGTEGLTVGGNGTLVFKPEHAPVNGYNTAISSHYPVDRIYCGADINIQNALDGTGYDTWAAFTAAQYAAGTPVQVVWPLASPVEIQLTPAVISAVDPEQTNTLYGDSRIDVEYVKPLHVSIEERVAAAVAAAMQTE